MATIHLPPEFREFLKSFNESRVEYLVIGGFAVGMHGYPRATGDLDVWVACHRENAERIVEALVKFGFSREALSTELFLIEHNIVRFGTPPVRIEIHLSISGVSFSEAIAHIVPCTLDGVTIPVISLPLLRKNKAASGRGKDLADLENLPE